MLEICVIASARFEEILYFLGKINSNVLKMDKTKIYKTAEMLYYLFVFSFLESTWMKSDSKLI